MLAQLSGDEGVGSVCNEVRNRALSASGKNGDALRAFASIFNRLIGFRKTCLEFLGEFAASALRGVGEDGDILTLVGQKGVDGIEAEGFGEQGVVADFRVAIEREV